MTIIEPTVTLTNEQVQFFHTHGYLSLDSVTTQAEIARMREVYDELFTNRTGRDEGMEFDLAGTDEDESVPTLPQILDPLRFAEGLRNTLYQANALAISRQLLGDECQYSGSHAILKPARYGSETPWHQDQAYWDPRLDYRSLSVWMPLQEATVENGCMEFLPGSHQLDVLPHHHIGDDPRIHGLEVDKGQIDPSLSVACPLPAGGATFHHSKTFHYTAPNRSDQPRRALILVFGCPTTTREQPYDFYWQAQEHTLAQERRAQKQKG